MGVPRVEAYVSPDVKADDWLKKLKKHATVTVYGIGRCEDYHKIGNCDIFITISSTVFWRFPYLRNVHILLGQPVAEFRHSRLLVYNGLPEDIKSFVDVVMGFRPVLDVDVRKGSPQIYRGFHKLEFTITNMTNQPWLKGQHFVRLVWRAADGSLIENAPRTKVDLEHSVQPGTLLRQMVPLPQLPISVGNLRLRGWVMDVKSEEVSGCVEIPCRVMR